jgi:spore maturation protein CgeB
MRSFEIPGIGGIQLAPDTPEHRMFFEPGREIFLFRTVDECAEQVRRLIELPAAEAMEIRQRARKRSLDSGYSYRDRAQTVLTTIQQYRQQSLKGSILHATI